MLPVFAHSILRCGPILIACSLAVACLTESAHAVPSFGQQTNQPCSACHVGSFGPRLKQAGRDFKLYGYTGTDNTPYFPPISVLTQGSFTHTDADQAGGAAPGFGDNDNFAFDELSLFYAGKIFDSAGAFAEVVYDGIERKWHWEDVDIRYAREARLFGRDAVVGVTVNNAPTVSDLWEASPGWIFPAVSSGLAATPAAAPLIDALGGSVIGAGVYGQWDDTLYLELSLYEDLDHSTLNSLGAEPVNGADTIDGPVPYLRLTLQHDFDEGRHYVEVGTYVLFADVRPQGIASAGEDSYTDVALDATYQWIEDPAVSVSDVLSVHGLALWETADLDASRVLFGTRSTSDLTTVRIDAAYSIGATLTPTVQYFAISGDVDPAHWATSNGSPNSNGWILQLDYVPWGKPDSPLSWINARFALQYTAYDKFDGERANASDHNTLLLNTTLAFGVPR